MVIYRKKTTITLILLWPLLVILLCWPAIINGSAIFFYDSLSYLGSPATAFREVFGLETIWTRASGEPAIRTDEVQTQIAKAAENQTDAAEQQTKTQSAPEKNTDNKIVAGRSIYYGVFLFLSSSLGSLWFSIALQSMIVILSIYMTFAVILSSASIPTFLSLVVLGIFSSLPFYVSYLMPDFLAGIVILAVANLTAFGDRMQRWMFPVWGALLLFGLVSHSSHILIASAMIVGWGLFQVIRRRTLFSLQFFLLVGTVGAAVVAEVAFFKAVESVYGSAPVRPPFLMARTISDGPGYTYLADHCDHHHLRICDFVDVLPQDTNEILWSKDPERGVYGISDAETRRELADQQMEFVLSVLRYDPFGQIAASFQGFMQQFLMIRLVEFDYNPSLKSNLENNLPSEQKYILTNTLLYEEKFPLKAFDFISISIIVLSSIYIFYIFRVFAKNKKYISYKFKELLPKYIDIVIFVNFVVAGVFLNAAITGILSNPHHRYQARVIWLVPFLGMYLACLRYSDLMRPWVHLVPKAAKPHAIDTGRPHS